MNAFEKKLARRIREDVPDLKSITPGVTIEAWSHGRKLGCVREGRTYKYYDLASLTKIIFTATASMQYFSGRKGELTRPVRDKIEWLKLKVTPQQLLTHTAGLEWWLPMYKKFRGSFDPPERWAQMECELAKLKPKRRTNAVYSDPDLWLMGAFLREACGFELHDLWEETADRAKVRDIFFHPRNRPLHARRLYAPTERCGWRMKILRGEVHDENCWSLGGVSSHAGLFGTVEGVARWGLGLRKAFYGNDSVNGPYGASSMVRYFTGRRIPRAIGDWGLGFMKPSRPTSSCGKYLSVHSFGHTGFTGTSFWFDPKRDLLVVILSNRVHPTRDNQTFLKLRPILHNFVVECL